MKGWIGSDEQGQSLVEFGLTFGLFVAFIYGLLGVGLWGTSAFLVQEAAHSAARCYAGTGDSIRAVDEAELFVGRWALPFFKSHYVNIDDDGEVCTVKITAVPRDSIRKLFIFQEDVIVRESTATKDYALRYQYQFTGN